MKIFILRPTNLFFDFNSTNLTKSYTQYLNNAINIIKSDVKNINKILIIHHNTQYDSNEYNKQLSQKRQNEIAKYLSMQGISTNLINLVG